MSDGTGCGRVFGLTSATIVQRWEPVTEAQEFADALAELAAAEAAERE